MHLTPPIARLRVWLDARMWRHSGIGRVTRCYAGALAPHLDRLICAVADEAQAAQVRAALPDAELVRYPAPIYSAAEQRAGARLMAQWRDRVDAFLFPQYNAPWNLPAHSVVMVHDLIQFDFGDHPWWKRRPALALLARVCRRAGRVLIASAATRRALAERLGGAGARWADFRHGLEPTLAPWDDAARAAFRAARGLGPYLLLVANKKPHKNLGLGLTVWEVLAAEFPALHLVLVGERFPEWAPHAARARALGPRVHDLADLDAAEVAGYLAAAEVLLQPSWAEGFGLPPLEAMACGVPVVSSTRTSLPEVCGDAALYADPANRACWVAQVRALLLEPALRARMRARGRARAAAFPVEAAAAALLGHLAAAARER